MANKVDQGLEDFLNGNERGFAPIRDYYKAKIYAQCYHIIGNKTEAEKVTADIFRRLEDKIGKFQSVDHIRNYLFDVAKKQSRKAVKRLFPLWKKRIVIIDFQDLLLDEILPDDTAMHLDILEREVEFRYWYAQALKHIDKLPAGQRELFRMRYQEDKTAEEIAAIKGVTPNSVHKQLSSAKAKLRKKLVTDGFKPSAFILIILLLVFKK